MQLGRKHHGLANDTLSMGAPAQGNRARGLWAQGRTGTKRQTDTQNRAVEGKAYNCVERIIAFMKSFLD